MKKIFSLAVVCFITFSCGDDLEVGQTWVHITNKGNPYQKQDVLLNRIIDINGDYVLFVRNEQDTLSEEKYWFKLDSELLK